MHNYNNTKPSNITDKTKLSSKHYTNNLNLSDEQKAKILLNIRELIK